MRTPRILSVLALTALLAMPAIPAATRDGEGPAAPRTEWRQAGVQDFELKANGSVYESSLFKIPVPANASVTTASCDVKGGYVKGPLTYAACDFSDEQAGHKAYKASTNTFSRNTPVWSLAQSPVSSGEYSKLAASDDDRLSQLGDWTDQDGYELFRFHVPVDESRTLVVNWEGYASLDSLGYYFVYIWNNFTGIWELLETANPTADRWVRMQFDTDYYINDRSVWVLAMNDNGGYIHTDYVNITISGYPFLYPKNPMMDIGGDGKPEWSLKTEKLDHTVMVYEPAMLQALDDAARGGTSKDVNVTIRFVSDTPCRIRLSAFSFNFSAPPWCRGIPNIVLDEDSAEQSVVDLAHFFQDDVGGKLTYQVSYQQDSKRVQCLVNADGHTLDVKTVTRNWWGSVNFRVRAVDSEGLSGESGNFTVTVRPVNDAPIMPQIPAQMGTQGLPFTYKVTARDVDVDLDPTETVTYSDNASFFAIDPQTGWINFTPRQEDVGTWYICVTATDSHGEASFAEFSFLIEDVQDRPVMMQIPDLRATEDEPFSYTVEVKDPDLPYGDALTFSDDCALFNITPDTGVIAFTPTIREVGFYQGNITVRDRRGGVDRRMFNLSVFNSIGSFDRPPSVEPIPDFTVVEGTPFTYQVNASDPDEDDSLSFKDSCPIFIIGASNGTISFTPKKEDIGTYLVKITVSDWEGLDAETSFRLTVLRFNSPPVITSFKPKNGTKVLFDHEVVLSADATDPEADRLSYTWVEGNRTLGRGSSIVTMFSLPGTYVVTLVVNDSRDETTQNITLQVVTKLDTPKSSPGFGTVLVAGAAAIVAVLVARRRKR
ncbi:MAG: hypothetical protein FJ149_02220 [Euryarchaeota archaeon]|nr:hypothetical protein [Euryarchaeota archaeon]